MKKGKGSKPLSTPFRPTTVGSQISEADRALFSPAELEALENEAALAAQEDMRNEARARVIETLKAQKRAQLQSALDPDEEMYLFTVDLAPYADRITLDGVIYMHGATYEVPRRQFQTMNEIVARSWAHEREIGNANAQDYRKPRNIQIGPKNGSLSAEQLLRV